MFRTLRHLFHLCRIAWTLARNDALFPLAAIPQLRPFARLVRRLRRHDVPERPGERLARALEELGPAFIKLGQTLATRADILSDPIARDLAALQDRLPSFPGNNARAMID